MNTRILIPSILLTNVLFRGIALPAADDGQQNEVIILTKDPAAQEQVALHSDALAEPALRGDTYGEVWHHPEQTFIDSDIGPLPLWTETVYDAHGNPAPRFPDVFTKQLLDNPSEETAYAYLESQRVRARRYLQASEIMQQVAVKEGYVTPEAFRPPEPQNPNSRALVPNYNLRKEDWGTPALNPDQARVDGLTRADIPSTPGKTTTRSVEVLMFWDHRCQYSMQGFRDYAELGEEVYSRELGPRFMTISMDNDSVTTKSYLDYLQYTGVPTKHIENWLDQTDLAQSMHIQYTPTYVFLDRRTGKIQRIEGVKDKAFLRSQLLDLVGHNEDGWDHVSAAWFRPTAAAAGSGRAEPTASPTPSGATPVQPATRQIRAWDPDGVQDR